MDPLIYPFIELALSAWNINSLRAKKRGCIEGEKEEKWAASLPVEDCSRPAQVD